MVLSRYILIAIVLALPIGVFAQVGVTPLPFIPETDNTTEATASNNQSAASTQQAESNSDRMQSLAAQMAQRIMRGNNSNNGNSANNQNTQNTTTIPSSSSVATQALSRAESTTETTTLNTSETTSSGTNASAVSAPAPVSAPSTVPQAQSVRRPRPNPATRPASATTSAGSAELAVPVAVRDMSPLVVVPSRQPVAATPPQQAPSEIPVVEVESSPTEEVTEVVDVPVVAPQRRTVVVNAPSRSSTVLANPVLARPAPADLLQAPRIIQNIQTAGTVPQMIRPIAPVMQQGDVALQHVPTMQGVQHGEMQTIAVQGVAVQSVAEQNVVGQSVVGQSTPSLPSTFSLPSLANGQAQGQVQQNVTNVEQAMPVMPTVSSPAATQVHMVQVAQPTQEPMIQPSRNFIPVHDDGVNVVGSDSYTVQPGDYLMAISRKVYGNDAGWARILAANPQLRSNPDVVVPGMVLNIPR